MFENAVHKYVLPYILMAKQRDGGGGADWESKLN